VIHPWRKIKKPRFPKKVNQLPNPMLKQVNQPKSRLVKNLIRNLHQNKKLRSVIKRLQIRLNRRRPSNQNQKRSQHLKKSLKHLLKRNPRRKHLQLNQPLSAPLEQRKMTNLQPKNSQTMRMKRKLLHSLKRGRAIIDEQLWMLRLTRRKQSRKKKRKK